MNIVSKKIDRKWFNQIDSGIKKYELRLADFKIKKGDTLELIEYTKGENRKPTGKTLRKKVTHVRKCNIKEWISQQPELLEKGFYIIEFE